VFETVATVVALELHVAVRTALLAFDNVAVACKSRVSPSTSADVAGDTATDVTLNTSTAAVPVFPPATALMVAVPGAIARTTPSWPTVATLVALLLHTGTNALAPLPVDVVTAAVNVAVSLGASDEFPGDTLTAVTVTVGVTGVMGVAGSLPPPQAATVRDRTAAESSARAKSAREAESRIIGATVCGKASRG